VPLQNAFPLFFALAGLIAATLFTRRALALMDAGSKAALLDSISSTRLLSLLVAGVFVALVLWHPLFGWVFLGCAYLGLGIRSLVRLRRLPLPPRSARLILIGNLTAVLGIILCALLFALRALD
jgi:hypothetical protein